MQLSQFNEIIEILTDWIYKFDDLKKRINDLFPTFDNLQGKMHILVNLRSELD